MDVGGLYFDAQLSNFPDLQLRSFRWPAQSLTVEVRRNLLAARAGAGRAANVLADLRLSSTLFGRPLQTKNTPCRAFVLLIPILATVKSEALKLAPLPRS